MMCPLCSNKAVFIPLNPKFCRTNNYLCRKCGLVFIPRRKTDGHSYYKEDGYFKKSPNIAYKKQLISKSLLISESEKRISGALEIFSLDLKNKRVLDAGCGYGEILSVLKKRYNCNVEGIEPSPETAVIGSKMFSLSIRPMLLEEFKPKQKYDFIWTSHVLEHTNDPNEFLQKIRKILEREGFIYVELPNILKPSGGFSLHKFLYEEHLQTFSVYNLYLLLKKNGFKIVAYSDSGFLKFWCQVGAEGIKPKLVTSKQIVNFLHKYKDNHNLFSYIKVYWQKGSYATKIALFKIKDLISVTG